MYIICKCISKVCVSAPCRIVMLTHTCRIVMLTHTCRIVMLTHTCRIVMLTHTTVCFMLLVALCIDCTVARIGLHTFLVTYMSHTVSDSSLSLL